MPERGSKRQNQRRPKPRIASEKPIPAMDGQQKRQEASRQGQHEQNPLRTLDPQPGKGSHLKDK
jgi:hypothetical protein